MQITKQCSVCKLFLPTSKFSSKQSKCKDCRRIYLSSLDNSQNKILNKEKKWYSQGIDKNFKYNNYIDMIRLQDGKCDICMEYIGDKLVVDHNHQTGKVRGLLCNKCNLTIGMINENISHLFQCITYILKS